MTTPCPPFMRDRRLEPKGPRGRHRKHVPWSARFGATVHQTASVLVDGRNLPAHVLIQRDGTVDLLHDLTERVSHGHALNGPTWGIEVECREPGLVGIDATFWRSTRERRGYTSFSDDRPDRIGVIDPSGTWHPPRSVAELLAPALHVQYIALREVLLWGADVHAEQGAGGWAVYTHRQGHASRTSDPGEAIAAFVDDVRAQAGWPDVSLEAYGTGRPQPDQWVGGRARARSVRYRGP